MILYRMEDYQKCARQAVAEGCVLLENRNVLPLHKGEKIAVFGVNAFHYYKSGLGSGGLVNARYTVSILDALETCPDIILNQKLKTQYEEYLKEYPFDEGSGWGNVPWSQKEMPVDESVVAESRKESETAVIMIGRTAGEDQDNTETEGSYFLTAEEKRMIHLVCLYYERSVVLLNTGNIIDMSFVEQERPGAVMYVWQGGQEGGNGVLDILLGERSPSGKLTDTIAFSLEDYPSYANFGDGKRNEYQEGIFVGYRYFETFKKDRVRYPFGYGLTYSHFSICAKIVEKKDAGLLIGYQVKNEGTEKGSEVVQIYVEAPDGRLQKSARVLVGFQKTEELMPGETEKGTIYCRKADMASFDDTGVTGHPDTLLLEAGTYRIYAGSDVRSARFCGAFREKEQILKRTKGYCKPEKQTQETVGNTDRGQVKGKTCQGNKGLLLTDVFLKKASMDDFLSQIPDRELIHLVRGEGMCSPKAAPGTAAAFGGLTEELRRFGIPVACCADGPSGIRMDCGTKAFSLPNGTALACTFNPHLLEKLFHFLGLELAQNKIDAILGPGMNIHRYPLNGRNFEYFSEDPFLTGKMAAGQLRGLQEAGVQGTIKHFCGNNQEYHRTEVEAVISERALWEIYLKGYEIAIREGGATLIMTTYGALNGMWTAGNRELCTGILREELGFQGMVMTDWWAMANWEGEKPDRNNLAAMVAAQNDLYMCCADTVQADRKDNLVESLAAGRITRGELLCCAENILSFILTTHAMKREMGAEEKVQCLFQGRELRDDGEWKEFVFYRAEEGTDTVEVPGVTDDIRRGRETCFGVTVHKNGDYVIEIEASCALPELAQLPVSVYMDNVYRGAMTFRGMNGGNLKMVLPVGYFFGPTHYVKLVYPEQGLDIVRIRISLSDEQADGSI